LAVNDRKTRRMFFEVVTLIYKGDPNYIRPLDKQLEAIFSPASNSFFKHGDATRFILVNNKEEVIGRVAAFINEKKAYGFAQPTGGMGFFECINDKGAARMLMDAARQWLQERGMKAMDGPVNFGENDTYWGLLVEGFTPPGFGVQYNPPYYKQLFEDYGFFNYFEQVTNILDVKKPFPERFWKIASRVIARDGYKFIHFKKRDSEKFVRDFVEIYDDAWQFHENFTPMNPNTLRQALKEASGFLDEELIWFVYYNDEPIAFLVMFPDVNQIIRHFNGKFNLWHKLLFLYYKYTNEMTRARAIIMGVKPKYQKLGIESGIFWHMRDFVARKPHIDEMELSWVGDFNPKMRAVHDSMGACFGKLHITYRCIFDEAGDIQQRAGSIPVDTRERLKTRGE